MNRAEKEVVNSIILDYMEYQRKADDHEGIAHTGEGLGINTVRGGKGLKHDPLSTRADNVRRKCEEIFEHERIAKELMWELTRCERICVYIWPSLKNQIKPGTQDRYRKADAVPYLRSLGLPFDQDRYEMFKELGEAGLLLAHKQRFPELWKKTG